MAGLRVARGARGLIAAAPTQSNKAMVQINEPDQREVHFEVPFFRQYNMIPVLPTEQAVWARSENQLSRLAAACVASAALLFATATLVMCSLLFMWSAVLRTFNCSSCCFA